MQYAPGRQDSEEQPLRHTVTIGTGPVTDSESDTILGTDCYLSTAESPVQFDSIPLPPDSTKIISI